jgi:hypothetical protein
MSRDYGISPRSDHYACIVDLLGQTSHLDEAHELISTLPIEPYAFVWRGLLSACRVCVNLDVGKLYGEHILELKPQKVLKYVLLSNIYAASKMRRLMKNRGIKRTNIVAGLRSRT